jgi:hypothetical protein
VPNVSSTPEERSLQARYAALTLHGSMSAEERIAHTSKARAGLEDRFLREAGGDPHRAEILKRAHFTRLALKSSKARRQARELLAEADSAESELAEGGAA